jgi:hypothetical protein
MASLVATDRLACRRKILMYKHMPADAKVEAIAKAGTTTETWTAFKGYGSFQALAMFIINGGGGGLIELSIYAAESAAGANATEIKTSGVIAGDALGDWAMQECTAEEIQQIGKSLGFNFTHVGAYLDCTHGDDEIAVVYILDEPLFKYDALTPATTIA